MVSCYTANLAAFLTTENADTHFSNVKELADRSEKLGIRYGAKAGGATIKFFKVTGKKCALFFSKDRNDFRREQKLIPITRRFTTT